MQENRQRTVDLLVLPIHVVYERLATVERLVTDSPMKYKYTVPSRSYKAQHNMTWPCGIFVPLYPQMF